MDGGEGGIRTLGLSLLFHKLVAHAGRKLPKSTHLLPLRSAPKASMLWAKRKCPARLLRQGCGRGLFS